VVGAALTFFRLAFRNTSARRWLSDIGRKCSVVLVGPIVVLVVLYGVGGDLFAYATGLRGGHLLAGGCGSRLQPGLRAAQLAAWAPFAQ
jgi:hypothetical protein